MFIGRKEELSFLNSILRLLQPGSPQLIVLHGRRRLGKTELLLQWAAQSGVPFAYWQVARESAAMQRNRLWSRLTDAPLQGASAFSSWDDLWKAAASNLQDKRYILIVDELPYALDIDSQILPALRHAWDAHFENAQVIVVLCGSQVRSMRHVLSPQSMLADRITARFQVWPLPFSGLSGFFPRWNAEERLAVYAIAGGVPAYLRWLDAGRNLVSNIREVILSTGSMFLAEPDLLFADEFHEPALYIAILKAIGAGCHSLSQISRYCLLPRTNVNAYLSNLQELNIVERRLPATLPPDLQQSSHNGRYFIADPFLRFYFAFLSPYLDEAPFDLDQMMDALSQNLPTFIGQTAFVELARQWVAVQGKAGELPFVPEVVGQHWSARSRVDVAALNWKTRQILLGICRWGTESLDEPAVTDLVEVTAPLVLRDLPEGGQGWEIYYACFARRGFNPAAQAEIQKHSGLAVDLKVMDQLLGRE